MYAGITVLDVFKIDNKVMLKRFQRASASLEAGKVKVRRYPVWGRAQRCLTPECLLANPQGLFCSLPVSGIERVVAFGMGNSPVAPAERAAIFRGTWMAAVANLKLGGDLPTVAGADVDWEQHGEAEKAVMAADSVPVRRRATCVRAGGVGHA